MRNTIFSGILAMLASAVCAQDIVHGEYWVNQDNGFGGCTPFAIPNPGTSIAALPVSIDLSGYAPGIHVVGIRTKDSNGLWGHTNHATALVHEPVPEAATITRVEAFNLTNGPDPGFGSAVPFTMDVPPVVFDSVLRSDESLPIDVGQTLAIRSLDSNGKWSLTNFLTVDSVVIASNVNIDDLAASFGISTYPNPFTEGITVRTDDGKPLRVVLYDPQGRLVHDKVLSGESYIDLSGHASGLYTAFFWKEATRIHRVQLVKQ